MNLTNVILNNRLLPINALLGGYILWLMIGMNQPTTMHVKPQLCFYGTQENIKLQAPEYVDLWIQSSRKTLHSIDARNTTAHIDIHDFTLGDHIIKIQKKNLFLPNNVKLLQLKPSEFTITLTPTNVETTHE